MMRTPAVRAALRVAFGRPAMIVGRLPAVLWPVAVGVLATAGGVFGTAGGAVAQQVERPAAVAAHTAEERTARYFDSIRNDPVRTLIFLRGMPKGADLHSHLSGAIYTETYIRWAAEDGACVDMLTGAFVGAPCDAAAGRPPAAQALRDPALHDLIIDAQSMRNWHQSQRSGHEQFFGAFDKFRIVSYRTGEMLAEVTSRAAAGKVSYIEPMLTPEGPASAELGRSIGWDEDLSALRERLLQVGLRDTLQRARQRLDAAEATRREVLGCDGKRPDPGCAVVVRFQYQALRARSPEMVFGSLLAGFELASSDPRVVGINFVQPEDHVVAMRDYLLHMRMMDMLRRLYPDVRLTLHAGELRSGLVPPEGLRFHIRGAIESGHASRIGHGVSIAHEHDPYGLLRTMAERNILVEIALGSNDAILGVRGRHHPLRLYMSAGVPVALVTDDEGVLRSELTMEYLKAVEEHDVGYLELKSMARNSLEFAFVEGASLWADLRTARPVSECAGGLDVQECRRYVAAHTRARLQRELERSFAELEQMYDTTDAEEAWTSR
ncbi:adenosine deaminase [soil metagenome]